jgi:hypothetical protein
MAQWKLCENEAAIGNGGPGAAKYQPWHQLIEN